MNKDEMNKELSEQISTLTAHAESLTNLLSDLKLAIRPQTGDVTFTALDRSKEVLDNMSEVRSSVEKVRRTLKARAVARMKEG